MASSASLDLKRSKWLGKQLESRLMQFYRSKKTPAGHGGQPIRAGRSFRRPNAGCIDILWFASRDEQNGGQEPLNLEKRNRKTLPSIQPGRIGAVTRLPGSNAI